MNNESSFSKILMEQNREYLELRYNKKLVHLLKENYLRRAINFKLFLLSGQLWSLVLQRIRSLRVNRNKNGLNKESPLVPFREFTGKLVVYTCIVGDYDIIREPLYVNPKVDYIVVTDKEVSNSSLWKKIDISKIKGLTGMSNAAKNRYIKLHPHLIFPSYEASIYLDGNILIVADLMPMVNLLMNSSIGLHLHSGRDCVFNEAKAVIALGKARKHEVKQQMRQYKNEGFPKNFGLFENNVIIRKHLDKKCIEIMQYWWRELRKYELRDQLCFTYVLWKLGLNSDYVSILGTSMKLNPRFRYYNHN